MTRRLIIEVDDELCVSSQNCLYSAPATFELGDEGAQVLPEPHDDAEAVIDAGRNCPQGAIAVRDADTGEDLLDVVSDTSSKISWRVPGSGDG
jgi:ferredoxin